MLETARDMYKADKKFTKYRNSMLILCALEVMVTLVENLADHARADNSHFI